MKILARRCNNLLILFHPSCLRHQNNFSQSSVYFKKKAEESDDIVFQYKSINSKPSRKVYSWGFAGSGALGNSAYLMPENERLPPISYLHKPGKLKFSEIHKVKDVACGYGYTVISVVPEKNEHQIFGTGLNTDCQIGYHSHQKNHPLEVLIQPVPIGLPLGGKSTKVIKVACGRSHTVVLTDSGTVFTFGNNSFGQCGRPIVDKEDYSRQIIVHKLTGIEGKVVDIVCGQDHTVLRTEDGNVYSCGLSSDGQTGLGHFKSTPHPQQCKGDITGEKIVHVSTSSDCVLAVNDQGDLFGWGNSEYGQLQSVTEQQQVHTSRCLPIKHTGKIVHSTAGGTMCGIVNDLGQVFVWGYGILGKGPNVDHIASPEMLPEPLFGKNEINKEVKVKSIHSSLDYFAAVTDNGDLYAWGKNSYGKLGIGSRKDQFFPLRVSFGGSVSKVSLGPYHMAVVTTSFI